MDMANISSQISKSWANAAAVADWQSRKQTLKSKAQSPQPKIRKGSRRQGRALSSTAVSFPTPRRSSRRQIVDSSSSPELPDRADPPEYSREGPAAPEISETPTVQEAYCSLLPFKVSDSQHSSFLRDQCPAYPHFLSTGDTLTSPRNLSSESRAPLISPRSSPPTPLDLIEIIPDSQPLSLPSSEPPSSKAVRRRSGLFQRLLKNQDIRRSPRLTHSDRSSSPTQASKGPDRDNPDITASFIVKPPLSSLYLHRQVVPSDQTPRLVKFDQRISDSKELNESGKGTLHHPKETVQRQLLTLPAKDVSANTPEAALQPLSRSPRSPELYYNRVLSLEDSSPTFLIQQPLARRTFSTTNYTEGSIGKHNSSHKSVRFRVRRTNEVSRTPAEQPESPKFTSFSIA